MMFDNVVQIVEYFYVIYVFICVECDVVIVCEGKNVCIVLINGLMGLIGVEIVVMFELELVCVLGVGYENIDVEVVCVCGVVVVNGVGINDVCVVDYVFGLLLVIVCGIFKLDWFICNGVWCDDILLQFGVCGKCLGIVGLGIIGMQIVCCVVGFDMQIGYYNCKLCDGVLYCYFDVFKDMVEWVDFLIVVMLGGVQIKYFVNQLILEVLGFNGYVVNIVCGSVVDMVVLEVVICVGKLGGVGLDVYESELKLLVGLFDLEQVVLMLYIVGWLLELVQVMVDCFLENVCGYLVGIGVVFLV